MQKNFLTILHSSVSVTFFTRILIFLTIFPLDNGNSILSSIVNIRISISLCMISSYILCRPNSPLSTIYPLFRLRTAAACGAKDDGKFAFLLCKFSPVWFPYGFLDPCIDFFSFACYNTIRICRCGGIGRRLGLKIRWDLTPVPVQARSSVP